MPQRDASWQLLHWKLAVRVGFEHDLLLSARKLLVFQYARDAVFALFAGWRYMGSTRASPEQALQVLDDMLHHPSDNHDGRACPEGVVLDVVEQVQTQPTAPPHNSVHHL